jgi:hypothetical protein
LAAWKPLRELAKVMKSFLPAVYELKMPHFC